MLVSELGFQDEPDNLIFMFLNRLEDMATARNLKRFQKFKFKALVEQRRVATR